MKSCSVDSTLSQPVISHHFKKLADAGIIEVKKDGVEKLYALNRDTLREVGIDASKL